MARYFEELAFELPGKRHFKLPATTSALALPESFAFRASFESEPGVYTICVPPGVDPNSIDLKIGDNPPLDIGVMNSRIFSI